jgi:hypothetical protein
MVEVSLDPYRRERSVNAQSGYTVASSFPKVCIESERTSWVGTEASKLCSVYSWEFVCHDSLFCCGISNSVFSQWPEQIISEQHVMVATLLLALASTAILCSEFCGNNNHTYFTVP